MRRDVADSQPGGVHYCFLRSVAGQVFSHRDATKFAGRPSKRCLGVAPFAAGDSSLVHYGGRTNPGTLGTLTDITAVEGKGKEWNGW